MKKLGMSFLFLMLSLASLANAAPSDLVRPHLGTYVRASHVPATVCAIDQISLRIEGDNLVEKITIGNHQQYEDKFVKIEGGYVVERRKSDSSFFGKTYLVYISTNIQSGNNKLLVQKIERYKGQTHVVQTLEFSGDRLRTGEDLVCEMVRGN